jgi:hypothetical protein
VDEPSPSPASQYGPYRRRDCLDELVPDDGSEHVWFGGRDPVLCTLLAFVDDARRLMTPRSVASESVFVHFRATHADLKTHGKPVVFYSDRHSILRVKGTDAGGGESVTQFSRPLSGCNIDIACANGP